MYVVISRGRGFFSREIVPMYPIHPHAHVTIMNIFLMHKVSTHRKLNNILINKSNHCLHSSFRRFAQLCLVDSSTIYRRLFNCLGYVISNAGIIVWKMNWKGFGRKRSLPILRYPSPAFTWSTWGKQNTNSGRIAGLRTVGILGIFGIPIYIYIYIL